MKPLKNDEIQGNKKRNRRHPANACGAGKHRMLQHGDLRREEINTENRVFLKSLPFQNNSPHILIHAFGNQ